MKLEYSALLTLLAQHQRTILGTAQPQQEHRPNVILQAVPPDMTKTEPINFAEIKPWVRTTVLLYSYMNHYLSNDVLY